MAAKRTHDLCVVTGEYTTRDGETKKRYLNVGVRLQYDDGGTVDLFERWFNFAGLPGDGSVGVRAFEIKPKDGYSQPTAAAPARQAPAQAFPEDDIPF